MNHATEGTIQAYLDGELPARERAELALHVETCPQCAGELAALRSAAARFHLLALAADVPVPPLPTDELARRRRRARSVLARRVLTRAAVLLVFVAGAAAALPGTPLHRWAVGLWNDVRTVIVRRPAAVPVAPVEVEVEPTAPAASAPMAVSVSPLGGELYFTIARAAPRTRLHIEIVDAPRGAVRATGAATAGHFSTAAGRIDIADVPAGDITIRIPRDVRRATVVADGRPLLVKEGASVRLLATPADSSAAEIVFEIGG